jgi:tRNA dimethylallyltransferase
MQVYKGMDILSSKPPKVLRKKLRHHLIDIIPATQEYNVSRYRHDALRSIKRILKKGKVPLFVGGTGLYMSILIDGIFNLKAKNKDIRAKLSQKAQNLGSHYLHERLKKVDPQAASKIHPNDTKRIIRALEVFQISGQPISKLQNVRHGLAAKFDINIFCLNMERHKLYQRIEKRVDKMFSQGLLQEVKQLLKLKLSQTARFAIGIRELKGYFEGRYGVDEAKRLIKKNTKLYAKRQLTWFRKDKRIKWIKVSDNEKPKEVSERIWKELY